MKLLKLLALSVTLLTAVQAMQQPSSHTKGTPTGKPTGQLKPGQYWWNPQLSPSGPLMVLVSVHNRPCTFIATVSSSVAQP
jgi:hypothetical protein